MTTLADVNKGGMILCPIWLNTTMAAQYLCITENTLRLKVRIGTVRSYKFGKQLRYKVSDLQDLIKPNEIEDRKIPNLLVIRKTTVTEVWSKENILKALLALKNNGVPLQYSHVRHKEKNKVNKILSNVLGQPTKGTSLIGAIGRKFKNWAHAIKSLNLSLDLTDKYHYWNHDFVSQCLNVLAKNNQFLSAKYVTTSMEVTRILTNHFGKTITGMALYKAAGRLYPNWEEAVKDAKVTFNKKGRAIKVWEKEFILDCIRVLAAHNLYLNPGFISTSKEVNRLLAKHSSKKISGKTLYKVGKKLFPTWNDAIRSSGLVFLRKKPILRKKKPSKVKSDLPIIDFTEEYVYTPNGYKMTKLMGAKVNSPDNILIESEMPKLISKILKPKTELEQFVIEKIIEKIIDGEENLDVIKDEIIEENKRKINKEVIAECLKNIKSSKVLNELIN